jgi:hypothetical protein
LVGLNPTSPIIRAFPNRPSLGLNLPTVIWEGETKQLKKYRTQLRLAASSSSTRMVAATVCASVNSTEKGSNSPGQGRQYDLPITRQAEVLCTSRVSDYCRPRPRAVLPVPETDLAIMRLDRR